jgi:dTDP-4-dehydrorhamnose reductase
MRGCGSSKWGKRRPDVRIAVVGAAGQLGAAIAHEFSTPHDVVLLTRADLDVTDDAAVASVIDRVRPEVIVNCAGYNDVDGAETHPLEALGANAYAVRALARAAERHHAALVHYSTDFVFDGTATKPYTENDAPNPRSAYAMSKLLGEWFALDARRGYVLRVESLFGRAPNGPDPKGSVAGIVRSLRAGKSPKVFTDRTISPTYVIDAARATRELIERSAPPGLYHCVNSGSCTWYELGEEAARQLGVKPTLTPVTLADATMAAPRPKFCALSNEKLQALGIHMPAWQDALARCIAASRLRLFVFVRGGLSYSRRAARHVSVSG